MATAHCAHLLSASSSLAALACHEFTKMKIALQSDDEVEGCADSGATKDMLRDNITFFSYRCIYNKVVTHGDGSHFPILVQYQ